MAEEEPKPKLSEVMGALVAGVAYGRQVADIEALRIAQHYQQNELLRGLPVPRLRLTQVKVSLPLIVSEVIPGVPAVRADSTDISRAVVTSLNEAIASGKRDLREVQKQTNLTETQQRSVAKYERLLNAVTDSGAEKRFAEVLIDMVKNAFLELEISQGTPHPSAPSLRQAAADATEKAFRFVMEEVGFQYVRSRVEEERSREDAAEASPFDPDRARRSVEDVMGQEFITRLIQNVRHAAEAAAVRHPGSAPDFVISVDTDTIKAAGGGPDAVTRLSLVLREEGLEWVTEINNGEISSKLMPE